MPEIAHPLTAVALGAFRDRYPDLGADDAVDLIRRAEEWERAEPGREQANARRRFNRALDKHASDVVHRLYLHMDAMGIARAVVGGDLEWRDGRKLVATKQGRAKARRRKRQRRGQ